MKPLTTWTVYTVALCAFWSSPSHMCCHWKAEGGVKGAREDTFPTHHLPILSK